MKLHQSVMMIAIVVDNDDSYKSPDSVCKNHN